MTQEELSEHTAWLDRAAAVARNSLCLRDRCGAVIVAPEVFGLPTFVIGDGWNGPPQEDSAYRMCELVPQLTHREKPKSDITCCVHAEVRAIMSARAHYSRLLEGAYLYFARLGRAGSDTGDLRVLSGPPYCTMCSRMALDVGLGFWVLEHADGIRVYPAAEYNRLSYEFHR